MAYCSSCGNKLTENAAFCSVCGKAVVSNTEQSINVSNSVNQPSNVDDFDYKFWRFFLEFI